MNGDSDQPAMGGLKARSGERNASLDKACQARALPATSTPARTSEAPSPGVGVQTEHPLSPGGQRGSLNHSTRLVDRFRDEGYEGVVGIGLKTLSSTQHGSVSRERTLSHRSRVEIEGAALLQSLDRILSARNEATPCSPRAAVPKMPSFSSGEALQQQLSVSRRYLLSQAGTPQIPIPLQDGY